MAQEATQPLVLIFKEIFPDLLLDQKTNFIRPKIRLPCPSHDGYTDEVSAYVTGCTEIAQYDMMQLNLCDAIAQPNVNLPQQTCC